MRPSTANALHGPPTYETTEMTASDQRRAWMDPSFFASTQITESTSSATWVAARSACPAGLWSGAKRSACERSWLKIHCTERAHTPQLPSYKSMGPRVRSGSAELSVMGVSYASHSNSDRTLETCASDRM